MGQRPNGILAHLIQGSAYLVVGLHLRPFSLFGFFYGVLPIVKTRKPHLIRKPQLFAQLPIGQIGRAESHFFQDGTLLLGQRVRTAVVHQAHVVEVLQELEIFSSIVRSCRTRLRWYQGAISYVVRHGFSERAFVAVAVVAGAFVKTALAGQDCSVSVFHFHGSPRGAKTALGFKENGNL